MRTFKTILAYFILILFGIGIIIIPSFYIGWYWTAMWIGIILLIIALIWAVTWLEDEC